MKSILILSKIVGILGTILLYKSISTKGNPLLEYEDKSMPIAAVNEKLAKIGILLVSISYILDLIVVCVI